MVGRLPTVTVAITSAHACMLGHPALACIFKRCWTQRDASAERAFESCWTLLSRRSMQGRSSRPRRKKKKVATTFFLMTNTYSVAWSSQYPTPVWHPIDPQRQGPLHQSHGSRSRHSTSLHRHHAIISHCVTQIRKSTIRFSSFPFHRPRRSRPLTIKIHRQQAQAHPVTTPSTAWKQLAHI